MSVKILPPSFLSYVDQAIQTMRSQTGERGDFQPWESQKMDRIRTVMESDPLGGIELKLLRSDFYRMYQEYDRRLGTSFLKTFPEYAEFFESCGQLVHAGLLGQMISPPSFH